MKIPLTNCICPECRSESAAGKFMAFLCDFWATIIIMVVICAFWIKMIEWSFCR